jgi:outer membrane protein OmpA-like peptidoglycan-associated protein
MKEPPEDATGSYWPGVADSLLAALMIVMLLAFGGLVLFALNPNVELNLMQQRRKSDTLAQKNAELVAENGKLRKQIEELEKKRAPQEPPIIELTDAPNDVHFKSGTAEITSEFSNKLREKEFPTLVQILVEHPTVDTIEIIGHTDDLPISSTRSNLDDNLSKVVAGLLESRILSAGSNADLGLVRAVAVQEEWRRWLANARVALPRQIEVRCYSAANAIPPPGAAALPKNARDEKARRIEIRFAQLNKVLPSNTSAP